MEHGVERREAPMTMRARAALAAVTALAGIALAIGLRAERLVGGADRVVRVEVLVPADAPASLAELETIWRARLRGASVRVRPLVADAVGRTVEVSVTGELSREAIVGALSTRGELALTWVRSAHPQVEAWCQALKGRPPTDDVRCVPDVWEVDGERRWDQHVVGPSPEVIVAAIDRLGMPEALPPDLALAYEWEPAQFGSDPDGSSRPRWRAYVVETSPLLTQRDVASAAASVDPNTGRWQVDATFTADGRRRFGDATTAHVGDKLAIIVDGAITSAPVVQSAIRGGRATVTVGGDDHRAQAAEAQRLAGALHRRSAPLPYGITATVRGVRAMPGGPWLPRLALGFVLGIAAFVVAGRVRSTLAFAPLVRLGRDGGPQWLALAQAAAVTAAVLAGLWWLEGNVAMAGVDGARVEHDLGADPRLVSVLALGLAPYLAAVLIVELIALAVPAWRRRRLGEPAARVGIDRAILAATVAFALLQAHFVATFLSSFGRRDALLADGLGPHLAAVASLVGGALFVLVAARAITRWGLGHGVVVLQAAVLARLAVAAVDQSAALAIPALALIFVGAIVAVAAGGLRVGRGPRLPWGGIVPISIVPLALSLAAFGALATDDVARALTRVARRPAWVDVAVGAAILVGVLWWYRRQPRVGLVVTAAFGAVAVIAPLLAPAEARLLVRTLAPALLGATAVELWVAARVRLGLREPVAVVVVHAVDAADAACDRLADAGIPHAAVNLHLRAIQRWLAAYAPISVVVAAADRERAEAVLASSPPA